MNDDPTVLLTPRGAAALARAADLRADRPERGELAVAAELRREFPADLAAAAMAQAELREAASAKFSRAGEMLFTRGGYEQASGELIARHRAARFAGARRVADLCCGIGGDLIALAALSVREVLAVDRDPAHARLALYNAGVYGADNVRACVADVRDVPLKSFDAVFIDPARRADARGGAAREAGPGRFRAGMSEPPLDWCFALTEQVPAVCVKAAPGLPAELIPPGWEAEFIADGRDLKEAVLWSPAFADAAHGERALRRATVLPGARTLTAVPGDPVPVAGPGEYLLDPSPAVTRAGLVEDLARTLGGWKIDEQIAFIALDRAVSTPFARTLRVLYSAPWNEKRFATRLRELGIGAADLRRRSLAGDVDQIRRRLKLAGPHRATIVLTRAADRPWGLICADVPEADLALAQHDAAHERGLPGVLHVVVDDADEPHPERHRRGPRPVDHAREVGVLERRHVLDRLRVGGLVVLQQQRRLRRDLRRHSGDLRRAVPVADLHRVAGQPEPRRPAAVPPHLGDAERPRDMVVLHSREVPDQPPDRVGVRVEPARELLGGQPRQHAVDRLPDAVEGVGQQFGTGHVIPSSFAYAPDDTPALRTRDEVLMPHRPGRRCQAKRVMYPQCLNCG